MVAFLKPHPQSKDLFMEEIKSHHRRVANIATASFTSCDDLESGETSTSMLKLNPDMAKFTGFYLYRMEPGARSAPHRHGGAEEFYVIEGELTDNDGTVYRQGDMVWLAPGTEHNSYSETGCLVAVFSEKPEEAPEDISDAI